MWTAAKETRTKTSFRAMYRPERGFERDKNYTLQTQLYEWIWTRKYTGLYIDEATQICDAHSICPSLFDLITRGRSRGIPVLSSSQRPSGLKTELMSEANNIYCFALQYPADRDKAFKFGGIETDLIDKKNREKNSEHYFIYSKNGCETVPFFE